MTTRILHLRRTGEYILYVYDEHDTIIASFVFNSKAEAEAVADGYREGRLP